MPTEERRLHEEKRLHEARINRDEYPEHDPAGFDERSREALAPNDTLSDIEDERARVYPAPLAGVEPLEGHAVDPDAEEVSVEDALIRERADSGWEQSGELSTQPATLGGADGLGIMRVVRSADGAPVGLPGTWRPGEGTGIDERFTAGAELTFVGPLHVTDADVRDVTERVRVTSTGSYVTEDGERYDIVNFEALRQPGSVG